MTSEKNLVQRGFHFIQRSVKTGCTVLTRNSKLKKSHSGIISKQFLHYIISASRNTRLRRPLK